MKKRNFFLLITFVYCINQLNAQSVGLVLNSILESNRNSIHSVKEYKVINSRNFEINGEDVSFISLSIVDPKMTKTELTILYNQDGSFRNLSYTATIEKGQTFDYDLFFKICGLDSNYFISEKNKSDLWKDQGMVYFPKEKLNGNYLIKEEKIGSITCLMNIFKTTDEEINKALTKVDGQPKLNFSQVSIDEKDILEFQKIPLGSMLWDITDALESYSPTIINGDISYVGEGKIINIPCSLMFQFHESVFYRGGYLLSNSYINDNSYNLDFEKLEKLLSEKYGNPKITKELWSTELFKGNKENIGLAISSGQLERIRYWELGDYRIILNIKGEKFKIKTVLFYELKEVAEKSNAIIQKSLLDEL